MSISKKIWLLVAVALATCAIVFSMALIGLQRVNARVVEITSTTLPAVLAASDVRLMYMSLHSEAYNRATSPAEKGEEIDKKMASLVDGIVKQINAYTDKAKDPEEKKVLDEAKMGISSFIARMDQVRKLSGLGESQLALGIMGTQLGPVHAKLSATFEQLMKFKTDQAATVASDASTTFKATLGITITAALAGLAVIGAMGFFLGRSITKPLGSMQKAITRTAAELDFTDTFKVRSDDEVGRTLKAYNELLAKLRGSFAEIQAASKSMSTITDSVDATSQEIAQNSHAQSDAASGMAAAIEELTVSISLVANQAQDAAHRTLESRDKADAGSEIILNTVNGIKTISDSVREASERINALRNDSESISSVANIIKEIADQTNLLALNAAIEAARAGEQGRGFAVVADEVRKLAERTATSTQEISALLAKMQGSAKQAVDTMSAVVREVDSGVENARLAGESIQSIRAGSNTVVSVVEEISEAVREQSTASTAIAQRIEQIAQMTERNSSAAETAAHSVQEMTHMSQEIARALAAYKV